MLVVVGEMRYQRSSYSEVKKRGYIQWWRKWMEDERGYKRASASGYWRGLLGIGIF